MATPLFSSGPMANLKHGTFIEVTGFEVDLDIGRGIDLTVNSASRIDSCNFSPDEFNEFVHALRGACGGAAELVAEICAGHSRASVLISGDVHSEAILQPSTGLLFHRQKRWARVRIDEAETVNIQLWPAFLVEELWRLVR